MNLRLFSNSTMPGEPYLQWTRPHLQPFLAGVEALLFVPYAGVDIDWDDYTARVADNLPGIRVVGLHTVDDKIGAVETAAAIVVGGGNTFCLLRQCQDESLLPAIRAAVSRGARYVGWSAGSNLACPTIKTTNDMPIVATAGLDALGLIRYQLNPHFTDRHLAGHGGESRSQRLHEFTLRNPEMPVLGLPEGMLVEVDDAGSRLAGTGSARLFQANMEPSDVPVGPIAL